MKNLRNTLLALVTSILFLSGFAKAAESFDLASNSAQVDKLQDTPSIPGIACISTH